MSNNSDKLIKSEIKGRQVTYYLTTEEDLNNVKSNSVLGETFTVLTSLAIGGIISVLITKATKIELAIETQNLLDLLKCVFIVATIIFGCITAYFYYKSFRIIEKIKGSGTVTSIKNVDQEEDTEKVTEIKPDKKKLKIIEATYWTPKAKLDVTEELRKQIVDNKLETVASNDIKGDPDVGTVKKLRIRYIFNGITVAKEFIENNKVVIP